MDPFTQGTLGAVVAQAARINRPHVRTAGVCGFLAGMAADLDVLIRSTTDPLLFLEYHRQFTHALVFIPVGGFVCGLAFYLLWGRYRQLRWTDAVLFCTLGYATHGLLDAATSYGTSLLWPFSDVRLAASIVPVVDPVFTIPLAALTLASWLKRKPFYAAIGLLWAACYLSFGAIQHGRAITLAAELAASRGHTFERIEAKPSFANVLIWKTIYETADAFHVDAARPHFGEMVFEGSQVNKLNVARDLPWLDPTSQQAKDIERFRIFSLGFVALDPLSATRIIDVRYSFVPNETSPLWSIDLSPTADHHEHARYLTHRDNPRASFGRLWALMRSPQPSR